MKKSLNVVFLSLAVHSVVAFGPLVNISSGQTVGNPGFETPTIGAGSFQSNPPTTSSQPWTFLGESGVAFDSPAAHNVVGTYGGGQFAFMRLTNANAVSFSQPIAFSSPGFFTLSYLEAGQVPSGTGETGNLNYSVTIRQGASPAILSATDSTTSSQPFTAVAYSFAVPIAGTYTLTFAALSHGGANNQDWALFDNVSIVPEPSTATIVLSGIGLLGAATRRRRRTGLSNFRQEVT